MRKSRVLAVAVTLIMVMALSLIISVPSFADAKKPLYVAFVWHQHQPFYKNPVTGEYILPWVRLHAVKDYYDMVYILKKFPQIKVTFNLVPSLMYQINDYVYNGVKDVYQKNTITAADSLTDEQKQFVIERFFDVNPKIVATFPRYQELANIRSVSDEDYAAIVEKIVKKEDQELSDQELKAKGYVIPEADALGVKKARDTYTTQDYLDLQVLFNLAWIDPVLRSEDAQLKTLVDKARNYTEDDKKLVLSKQLEIMKKVLGIYKEYQKKGQIEVTTTPYFHPILPLVQDTNFSIRANEDIELGDIGTENFNHPEDVEVQLDMAVDYYKKVFGVAPKGLWPSEQSVCPEIIQPVTKAGFNWWVTSEGILAKSLDITLDKVNNPEVLYKPYYAKKGKKKIATLFRDIDLSDRIGFKYAPMKADDAVKDLIDSLHEIQARVANKAGNHIVTIALDGENCWEGFDNDGWDFLTGLYTQLSNDPLLKTVTVADYLAKNPPKDELANLWSGSWINDNYETWIGEEEENDAWKKLRDTRNFLVEFSIAHGGETKYNVPIQKAWLEIYAAEGSDWFWWYGNDQTNSNEKAFDNLFHTHLQNVYRYLGVDIPDSLKEPIIK